MWRSKQFKTGDKLVVERTCISKKGQVIVELTLEITENCKFSINCLRWDQGLPTKPTHNVKL